MTSSEVKWAKVKDNTPIGLVCLSCSNVLRNTKNAIPENRRKKNESSTARRKTAEGRRAHNASSLKSQSKRFAVSPAEREMHNARNVVYKTNRLSTDENYRFRHGVTTLIRSAFRVRGFTKGTKTFELVGCSFEELQLHLGIAGDVPEGYEIDHIIPVSLARNKEDFCMLQHFSNLQLLTRVDNLAKSDKLPDGRKASMLTDSEASLIINEVRAKALLL